MKLEERMTRLELAVSTHLEQSGTIKTDLLWLKRAFWALTGALLTFSASLAAGTALYLIKR